MRRKYIDIISSVGKRANIINPSLPYNLSNLLKEQNNSQIDASLCYYSSAIDSSYIKGNDAIIDISEQINNIFPIAVITPGIQYDFDDYENYLKYLISKNTKAVLINTTMGLFAYNVPTFDKTFNFCEKHNLPVMFDYSLLGQNVDNLMEILMRYENLKVVLYNITWAYSKQIFSYMEQNENLHVTFPSFQKTNIIEILCQKFGAERLLYSSNYPYTSPGAMKTMIEYANITEEEKNMISYKNAEKLFSIHPKLRNFSKQDSEITNSLNKGESLIKYNIIDAHAHLIGDDSISVNDMCHNVTGKDIILSMNKIGIKQALFSPMEGIYFDGISGNQIAMKNTALYNGSLLAYATANPHYKEDIDQALRCLEKKHFVGLKLYPMKNLCNYTDEKYERLFEEVINQKKIFLCHDSIEGAQSLASKYRDLKILLAHCAKSFEYADGAIKLSKEFDNVYFEISNSKLPYGVLEYLVNEISEDKIVFGTDIGVLNQSSTIGYVGYSNITDKQKVKVFSKNIKNFIRK